MVPAELVYAVLQVVRLIARISLDTADLYAHQFMRGFQLYKYYGPSGVAIFLFGNRTTWRVEAQILGQVNDKAAVEFKKSVCDECTMISVAAAIVAQIAITGLSLNALSETHWVARASFVISVIFALMAVYYATSQQRTLGRLLEAKQVRLWIRGGNKITENDRIVPSLDRIGSDFFGERNGQDVEGIREQNQDLAREGVLQSLAHLLIFGSQFEFPPSDPEDYNPEPTNAANFKDAVIQQCFTPSAASVITISAPQMLLSGSLGALLIGLGIYFGFTWTRNLDPAAGHNDSKRVFITYIVGLGISVPVYRISQLFQDEDKRTERMIMEDYLKEYVNTHPAAVRSWGVSAQVLDGELVFVPIAPENPAAEAAPETGDNAGVNGPTG